MKELIRISENEQGTQVVSAKELHSFLDMGSGFSGWIRNMLEYGFEQSVDYQAVSKFEQHSNGVGGTNKIDYALTLDCAKEISMIQRNDKGKIARKYFIAVEKQYLSKAKELPSNYVDALKELVKTLESKEKVVNQLNHAVEVIEQNKPKVVFAESVKGSTNSILVREYAKNLCDGTFEIGQKRLFRWFKDNGYLSEKNEPYQRYVDQGLFEVIRRTFGGFWGTRTEPTTKITGKGQVYFAEKIKTSF